MKGNSAVPLLAMDGIVKRYPGVTANDAVDLDIQPGQIHALLGENGAGKSTLMQIAYGMVSPDAGTIRLDGEVVHFTGPRDAIARGVGMIHQEFMLIPPFSVVENVVLGLKESRGPMLDLAAPARRIASLSRQHGLAVDPSAKVAHLPIGVRQRVEIVKLLYRDARLLILDEPTAVLTPAEVEGFFGVLRSLVAEGRSIVIVTHKLREVMSVADSVTVMRDGRVVALGRVAEFSPKTLAAMMVGREVKLRVDRPISKPGAALLTVKDLTVKNEAGREAVRGVSLALRAGEILGIAGVDGNGQSELVEALMNLRPSSGEVSVQGMRVDGRTPRDCRDARMAYIPADRRHVGSLPTLPLSDNAALGQHRGFSRHGLIDRQSMRKHARRVAARFGVKAGRPDLPVGQLSGGNLQRLILGREVSRDPLVLIVEQPTRGLDVGAIEGVWEELLAMRVQGKAILIVSAELEEIFSLSDRIAVMFAGKIIGTLAIADASIEEVGSLMAGSAGESTCA